eukprot:6068516-Karenia_brevis.AAC.1
MGDLVPRIRSTRSRPKQASRGSPGAFSKGQSAPGATPENRGHLGPWCVVAGRRVFWESPGAFSWGSNAPGGLLENRKEAGSSGSRDQNFD